MEHDSRESVYTMLGDIREMVGNINGKLDGIDYRIKSIEVSVKEHDKSIENINSTISRYSGIMVVVTSAVAFVWTFISSWVKDKVGLV